MDRIGKKCVLYSRVSTEMQVDGYSLAGQKTCLTKFAQREEMKVVKSYEDAGKSGKNIEGRPAFQQMLNDIKSGLQVDYVIVYKLSRFGRNAADVLNSLELIQDYGVNLICTDEGIDSSQASGRLLISVLSAVAQIERENIVEQTMNGRREKARQGLWNGGMAPYGYKLVDGVLQIKEDEAKIVKYIFEKYINTSISLQGISKDLNDQGILRTPYGNRVSDFWNPTAIRKIISNPTYMGKIEWGHRTMKKVQGTKIMKRVYQNDNIIYADGKHEAIIDEDTFNKAQEKREINLVRLNAKGRKMNVHELSSLLKCPVCGANMASASSRTTLLNGEKRVKYYYQCLNSKGRTKTVCNHGVHYDADTLEFYVRQAIGKVVTNEKIINDIKNKIGTIGDEHIDEEIANYEKRLKSLNNNKNQLEYEIDNMDCEDPNFDKKREVLNSRLNPVYDSIFEVEDKLESARLRKNALDNDKIKLDNIFDVLKSFDTFYDVLSPGERKDIYCSLISSIEITKKDYEHTEYGLKSIQFKFPIFSDHFINKQIKEEKDLNLFANISKTTECDYINTSVTFGDGMSDICLTPYISNNELLPAASIPCGINRKIIEYVKEKYNFSVSGQNIRFVRKSLGLQVRTLNKSEYVTAQNVPSIERFDAIVEALLEYKIIPSNILNDLDSLIENAKKNIDIIYAQQKGLKYYNSKFKNLLSYIKENFCIKVDANNVLAVKSLLGFEDVVELSNGQKLVTKIPPYDKAIIILKTLLQFNMINGNEEELSLKLKSIYDNMISNVNKKKRVTNSDIVDYVKVINGFTISIPMISYVRKKLGIIIKRKDSRTVEADKVNRIPSEKQYQAILDAMKHFKLLV